MRDETAEALALVADEARRYLAALDSQPAAPAGGDEAAEALDGMLPAVGIGAPAALAELAEAGRVPPLALPGRASSTS